MRTLMAVLAVTLAACSGGGDGDGVQDAVRSRIDQLGAGQFGQVWEGVHPAQQQIVSKEVYVRCATASLSGGDVTVDEVLDTYDEEMTIPGTDQQVTATNVTVRVEDSTGAADTQTYPFVEIDGEWRAILVDPSMFDDC